MAAARPETILDYNAEDHQHAQAGDAGNAVTGSYSFTDAEGKTYTINYVADENGYRATGDHLPVAPEVPEVPAAEPVAAEAPAPAAEPVVVKADVAPVAAPLVPAATALYHPYPYYGYHGFYGGYHGYPYAPRGFGYHFGYPYLG